MRQQSSLASHTCYRNKLPLQMQNIDTRACPEPVCNSGLASSPDLPSHMHPISSQHSAADRLQLRRCVQQYLDEATALAADFRGVLLMGGVHSSLAVSGLLVPKPATLQLHCSLRCGQHKATGAAVDRVLLADHLPACTSRLHHLHGYQTCPYKPVRSCPLKFVCTCPN
jgi:hypothetical protein